MAATNRQWIVTELPTGALTTDLFELREAPVPEPGPGEVLCRTRLLSIDAANRAWMQGATYTAPVKAAEVMRGGALAEVVASNDPGFSPGDIVEADGGWQDYSVHAGHHLTRVAVRGPLSHHLSVLGVSGLTSYFGTLDVGAVKPGETFVVSAAAGAAGNIAGQVAKIAGCRVVGITGGPEKCAFLTDELGFDAAVDHRAGNLHADLKAACPNGIDVYFDNTGGDILGAALWRMNLHGRIVCCGVVSQYDTADPAPGPRGVPGLLVTKRIRMEGFIVMDFFDRRDQALDELAGWVAGGRLKPVEDIYDGLQRAPEALVDLLHGGNIGKRMVRVSG